MVSTTLEGYSAEIHRPDLSITVTCVVRFNLACGAQLVMFVEYKISKQCSVKFNFANHSE